MPEAQKPPRQVNAILHVDGLHRCPWPGEDPLYVAYHDEEWGAPEWDDRALFEKLILDGFQAGLSWITILRKREAFRAAFDGFKPEIIADTTQAKIESLMQNAGIVRNRAKIEATIALARVYLDLAERGGFARHLWGFVDGRPIRNPRRSMREIPAETDAVASDLQGSARARRQFRRPDDHLRLHAGGRHGQRPSRRLPSPRGLRRARATRAMVSAKPKRPRLAADAVGAPARSDRPLAARRRNRRHRPRPRARRALERADQGAGDLLGRPAFAAGRGAFRRRLRRRLRAPRGWRRCCTTRPNM